MIPVTAIGLCALVAVSTALSLLPPSVPPHDPCLTTRCGPGERCVLKSVYCIRQPCPPQPTCLPRDDRPTFPPVNLPTTCAATLCPVGTRCSEAVNIITGVTQARCLSPTLPFTPFPPVAPPTTCATVLCEAGSTCREVVSIATGDREARCLGPSEVKAGECPKSTGFGICAFSCEVDSDCKGADKCCPTACGGTSCKSPVTVTPSIPSCNTVKCSAGHRCVMTEVQCVRAPCPRQPSCVPSDLPKEGVCPRRGLRRGGLVAEWKRCEADSQCPGDQKCCPLSFSLRRRCVTPVGVGPGPSGTCASVRCKGDQQCVMKTDPCFVSPCPSRPVCQPVKRCPVYPALVNPFCVRRDECAADRDDCRPGTVCCQTDCGRRCLSQSH